MAKSLNLLNGRTDSSGNPRRSRSTFVPPKFGTTSKTKKIERHAWEKEQTLIQTQEQRPNSARRSSSDRPGSARRSSSATPPSVPVPDDQILLETIHTLQEKYEENLQVIEQLYLEKKQMAKQVERLEQKLQNALSPSSSPSRPHHHHQKQQHDVSVSEKTIGTNRPPPSYTSRASPATAGERSAKVRTMKVTSRDSRQSRSLVEEDERVNSLNLTSPAILQNRRRAVGQSPEEDADDDLLHSGDQSFPESHEVETISQHNTRKTSQTLSALEAAELFSSDDPSLPLTSRSAKSLPTRSVYEPSIDRGNGPSRGRSNSAPRTASLTRSSSSPALSRSMTRSNSLRRSGPSPQLQAETDRYVTQGEIRQREKER
jgi:hypothetical protein